jgi:hypothetical protein
MLCDWHHLFQTPNGLRLGLGLVCFATLTSPQAQVQDAANAIKPAASINKSIFFHH